MGSVSHLRRWRLVVGIMILSLFAIPAAGIVVGATTPFQQVIVINPEESPIPVSLAGSNAISGTVNVGNLPATQPVSGTVNVGNLPATQPVSGTVNVGNSPTVQLDSSSVGHLANIDSATEDLTFDASGNLQVGVAGGQLKPVVTDQKSFGAFCSYRTCLVQGNNVWIVRDSSTLATITAYSFSTNNDVTVQFTNKDTGMTFELVVPGGGQLTGSFDSPLVANKFSIGCKTSSDCWVGFSVVGY